MARYCKRVTTFAVGGMHLTVSPSIIACMKKLTLKLNEYRPDTLPMKRLGQYLSHLSELMGEAEHVHFASVAKGSAMLNVDVNDAHYDKVIMRIREVPNGLGSKKRLNAYENLQRLMEEDGTGGAILDDLNSPVLSFKKWQADQKPLVVSKYGSVQGRLYLVGGKDDTIPVRLEDANGQTLHCEASTEVAQRLSALLFKQVRVTGHGVWERSVDDRWRLKKLKVETFTELDASKASSVLEKMRSLNGLKWAGMDDPHKVANRRLQRHPL